MSQQLIPLNGGVERPVLTTSTTTARLLSPQYIIANSLESRPTEWVAGGRPIYRRLPAVSETYQVDFFNIVPVPNTAVAATLEKIGYIYVPWTENSEGPTSIKVNVSENREDLLIAGGKIIWENGGTRVSPAIINLETLAVGRGRYFLAYQLEYDDTPSPKLYSVTDFALTGQPLTITSSTDNIVGWRYPATNAFLNTTNNFWTSKDTYFPTYAQPSSSYLEWESSLGAAYSQVVLTCPADTAYTATASLYYVTSGGVELFQGTVSPVRQGSTQSYTFSLTPSLNTGWKVVWSDVDVAIQTITVSGALALEEKAAAPSTQASLVLYPAGTEPQDPTYCPLAYIDVTNDFKVELVEDIRYVVRRDYQPVADWLTKFFDDNLIRLYEQVNRYPFFWMNPPTCMKQEYAALAQYNITVV